MFDFRAAMIEGIVTSLLADDSGTIVGVSYKDKEANCSKVSCGTGNISASLSRQIKSTIHYRQLKLI